MFAKRTQPLVLSVRREWKRAWDGGQHQFLITNPACGLRDDAGTQRAPGHLSGQWLAALQLSRSHVPLLGTGSGQAMSHELCELPILSCGENEVM